jgi:hypothetical protein
MNEFRAKMLNTPTIVFTALLLTLLIGSLFMQQAARLDPIAVGAAFVLYLICIGRVPKEELKEFYYFAAGVFFFGLLLNVAYELWHSVFYTHFTQPGYTYSELVAMLLGSAVGDGFLALIHLFVVTVLRRGRWQWQWPRDWKTLGFVILWALVVQIGIEIGALATGRWAYNSRMPVIPVLQVGLTPAIQMPLLMIPTLWLAQRLLCTTQNDAPES